ncbi:MAG: DMT family transporter [Anaerolineaceae bacterium]|nr:DMT family transporter [Anaerolineaceae bacterium]MCY3906357.1 DMT family transporter [Anaerolineaceae bacterium]
MTLAARPLPRVSRKTVALAVLLLGLFLASIGLIAMRHAQQEGLPSPVIVFMRLGIAALVFTPLTLPRQLPRIRRMPRRVWKLLLLAGVCFCADLMLFTEAIKYVNILLATVIASLMPLVTALMERFLLKVPLQRSMYAGMALAMAGGIVIALGSANGVSDLGPQPLLGATLSLLSVICACAYLIIGRTLRTRIPFLPYTWMLFTISALVALVVVLPAIGDTAGFSPQGITWALVATVLSQLGAHPAFIYAVASLSPTLISIASQSIILYGSVLAFLFLHQIPGVPEILGGAIILAGVIFAIYGQHET